MFYPELLVIQERYKDQPRQVERFRLINVYRDKQSPRLFARLRRVVQRLTSDSGYAAPRRRTA